MEDDAQNRVVMKTRTIYKGERPIRVHEKFADVDLLADSSNLDPLYTDFSDPSLFRKETLRVTFQTPAYPSNPVDYILVDSPIYRLQWLIPFSEVEGKTSLLLKDKWLYVEEGFSWAHIKGSARNRLKHLGEFSRPEGVPMKNWSLFQAWVRGAGYSSLSNQFGCTPNAIKQKIMSVLRRAEKEKNARSGGV